MWVVDAIFQEPKLPFIHQWDTRTFILSLVGINLVPDLVNSAHLRSLLYVTAHKSMAPPFVPILF